MDQTRLRNILQSYKDGQVELDQVMADLRHLPFEDLGFAHVDHHRALRQGFPEVIFGQGKTPEQVEKDSDRDYYMTAEEAKAYGLVDHVVASTRDAAKLAVAPAA